MKRIVTGVCHGPQIPEIRQDGPVFLAGTQEVSGLRAEKSKGASMRCACHFDS
ncbi:MAG: hypothetical protein ACK4LQ_14160 [Pararhodobacter sp.]